MSEDVCNVCSSPAAHRCSACKLIFYCSKEHQKQDWKNHKSSCSPFEVCTSPDLGKYLVASRDLSPGDMIFSERPLVVGPKLHMSLSLCLVCHAPADYKSEYRCPKCLWPCCGPSCPADPKVHAPECSILSLRAKQNLTEMAREYVRVYHYDAVTPLRCLLLQRRSPRKWDQLLQMEAHLRHRGPDTDVYREIQERVVRYLQKNYLQKLPTVGKEGETVLQDCSENILHRICGILDVNGLDIQVTPWLEVVALYPTVYLMEHDCLPNTRHSFEICPGDRQYRVTVKASRHIQKGEHISTMYTHALWGTQNRMLHLASTKYFTCRCKRCRDPTELGTYISGMRCLGSPILTPDTDVTSCGGTQLPISPLQEDSDWRCDRCPVRWASEDVTDFLSRIGEDVDIIQQNNPTVRQLEELVSKLSTFLHPHHYHLHSIKHSLVQLYGHEWGYEFDELSDQQLERKADLCRELLAVTDILDPGASRLTLYSSVLLYELHCAEFHLLRRASEKDPPVLSAEETARRAMEAKSFLLRAIEILEPEPDLSPGSTLLEVVRKTLLECETWMKDKRLTVST